MAFTPGHHPSTAVLGTGYSTEFFLLADLYNAELEDRRQHVREQRSPSSIILWLQTEEMVSLVQTLCCVMELQLLFELSPEFLNTFSICLEPSHFGTSFTHYWTL